MSPRDASFDPMPGDTPPLLRALRESGANDDAALRRGQQLSEQTGETLSRVLTRLGIVSEQQIAIAFAALSGAPIARLKERETDAEALEALGHAFAETALVMPLLPRDGGGTELAMADPTDAAVIRLVGLKLGRPVTSLTACVSEIEAEFERLAAADGSEGSSFEPGGGVSDADLARLKDMASDAPVIRLVNQIVRRAVEMGASDMHLEPFDRLFRLRYRVDGALREADPLPDALRAAIVSRLKIMARLDIAESRLPQDGRIKTVVAGRELDMRVATTPTLHGEAVVVRLLDRSGLVLDFDGLGMDRVAQDALAPLIGAPNGIALITGPTGSGKTTTLYAALASIASTERKIVTVEDPVEYQMPGIAQIQVQSGIGLGFAEALRSILRQDPDIIMIGEIRDLETARIAVQAALTGHLVLATLHTNSAAAAVNRLRDMGIPDYLLAATLNGAVAQRLVRKLCPSCHEPDPDAPALVERLTGAMSDAGGRWHRATGCPACSATGYKGRTTLMEVLPMTRPLRDLVLAGAAEIRIEQEATEAGMRSLMLHGVARARAGETSLSEVIRVAASI